MPVFLKAASIGGSIIVVIALAIALLKSLIAFVGFVSIVIKIVIVLVFVAVIAGVGYLIFKSWNERRSD